MAAPTDDSTAPAMIGLRHSDVSVTRGSYIKRVDEKSVEAMDRLEAGIRKSARKGVKSVKLVRERVQRTAVN
jgi:hypothetical protein